MKTIYFIMHFALCILNVSFSQEYTPFQLIGDIKDFNFGLALEVNSTTLSSRPCPKQTDVQRAANDLVTPPQEGDCFWSTDQKKQLNYDGAAWSGPSSKIENFKPRHTYVQNDLIIVNRDFYLVPADFISGADFNADYEAGNFIWFSPTDTVGGISVAPTVTLVPPNTVQIGSGSGVHADPFTLPGRRTFSRVDFAAEDILIAPNINSYFFIRVRNDGSKEVVYGEPTITNYQDDIIIAEGMLDSAGEVFGVFQHGWVTALTDSKVQDLVFISDVRNIKDNLFTPVAGTLNIQKDAGQIFSIGVNPTSSRLPNTFDSPAANPITYTPVQSDDLHAGVVNLDIDPNRYQPNGVGPLVAVTANKFTVQRFYMSARGFLAIQYGQKLYNTITEAISDLDVFPYIVNPILANRKVFLWAAYLVVQEGTVDLADTSMAVIHNCGQFGCLGSGSTVASAATGDVLGPSASTDNAIARFDETTGKIIQNSNVIISDATTVAPTTVELKASGVAIPMLRADGNTDNQQAGTLFLSQGDNFGYKIVYDALNTLDGLKIINRFNGAETTQALFKEHAIYLGTQDNNVVNNAGDGGVIIVGPTGGLNGGPHLQFNDNNDVYPIRQFLNWGHNNIWDCWDCFYDGANARHSTADSSFRWIKSASDLTLSIVNSPTVNGTEAFQNRFSINESGTTSIQMPGNATSNPPVTGLVLHNTNAEAVGNTSPGIFFRNGGRTTTWITAALADPTSDWMGRLHFWDTAGGFSNREMLRMDFGLAYFADTVSAIAWTTRSDKRLKKNIAEIPKSEIDKFNSLKPVQFNWQDRPFADRKKDQKLTDKEKDKNLHFGFIAQDIEKLFPNIVREGEEMVYSFDDKGNVKEDKIMAKEYSMADMLALTIKMVQEQNKKIKELEKRIEKLEKKLNGFQNSSQLPAKRPIKISRKPTNLNKDCCPSCSQKVDKTQLEMQNEYLKDKMDRMERELNSQKQINWWQRH